jgi:hypothetical protein
MYSSMNVNNRTYNHEDFYHSQSLKELELLKITHCSLNKL